MNHFIELTRLSDKTPVLVCVEAVTSLQQFKTSYTTVGLNVDSIDVLESYASVVELLRYRVLISDKPAKP